jgi:hypothetical protein
MLILSLVGVFKAKPNPVICRGFAAGTFGTSFRVKNVARHQCHFVRFMWILSLVGLFKPKTNAGVCREFAAGTFGTSS